MLDRDAHEHSARLGVHEVDEPARQAWDAQNGLCRDSWWMVAAFQHVAINLRDAAGGIDTCGTIVDNRAHGVSAREM